MSDDPQSKKWQLTINNPIEKGYDHNTIKLILCQIKNLYYIGCDEIGEQGTFHTHIFLVLKSPARFSRIKKAFPVAHIEIARGTVSDNVDYIKKEGRWSGTEKSETSVEGSLFEEGEPPADGPGQGFRTDLEEIGAYIESGYNPAEILAENFAFAKYERMIRTAYFAKRKRETPVKRQVKVHYIVGDSGSGKSYTYVTLCEEMGESHIYFLTDYEGGGFDQYCGEEVLFLDEYKGQFPFSQILILLDVYKAQIHARYSNIVALWNEVYITSVFPPEELYKKMVEETQRGLDKQQQLIRRITDITFCYADQEGKYQRYTIPMEQYTTYKALKEEALRNCEDSSTIPDWIEEAESIDDYTPLGEF